jgi:hypothetical protein
VTNTIFYLSEGAEDMALGAILSAPDNVKFRPGSGLRGAGQIALLVGVFAQVEQLLVGIRLATDIRPLSSLGGPQRRAFLG